MTTDTTKALTMEVAVTMPGYMEMHDCYPYQENENFGFGSSAEVDYAEQTISEFDDSYVGRFAQEVFDSKHNRARRRKSTIMRNIRAQRLFSMFGEVSVVPKHRQKLHHETCEKVSKMEAVARDMGREDAKLSHTQDFLLEDAQLQKEMVLFDAEVAEMEAYEKSIKRAERMRNAYYSLEGCSVEKLLEMAALYADAEPENTEALVESLKLFIARESSK